MKLDTLLNARGDRVFQAPPKSMRSYLIEYWGVFKGVCDVLPHGAEAPVPVEAYVGRFSELDWKEYFSRRLPELVPYLDEQIERDIESGLHLGADGRS